MKLDLNQRNLSSGISVEITKFRNQQIIRVWTKLSGRSLGYFGLSHAFIPTETIVPDQSCSGGRPSVDRQIDEYLLNLSRIRFDVSDFPACFNSQLNIFTNYGAYASFGCRQLNYSDREPLAL